MPELPEVEVTRRGIAPALSHSTIVKVTHDDCRLREPYSPELEHLAGAKVTSVERRAKYILIYTDKGTLVLHLGMTGHLKVQDADAPEVKHDHFALYLDNGKVIRLNDIRRFGLVLYFRPGVNPLTECRFLKDLGPEPFSAEFTPEYLYGKLQKIKRVAIKPTLMNSRIVVGVGNIYACEVLFQCGIDPRSRACDVTLELCRQLCEVIRSTLAKSIEKGGTTIRDFSGADGKPGYFVQNLWVYGHAGEKCRRCGTIIERIEQAQRSTFFCPHCQHMLPERS